LRTWFEIFEFRFSPFLPGNISTRVRRRLVSHSGNPHLGNSTFAAAGISRLEVTWASAVRWRSFHGLGADAVCVRSSDRLRLSSYAVIASRVVAIAWCAGRSRRPRHGRVSAAHQRGVSAQITPRSMRDSGKRSREGNALYNPNPACLWFGRDFREIWAPEAAPALAFPMGGVGSRDTALAGA